MADRRSCGQGGHLLRCDTGNGSVLVVNAVRDVSDLAQGSEAAKTVRSPSTSPTLLAAPE